MLFLRYLILLGVFPFLISHAMAINNYHTGNIVQEIIQVKGKVVTASGEAIPNATIIYGDKEASANNQGEFNISFPRATTIIVSAIGYETKQVFIDRSQEINVDLDVQDVDLDEVVVVGYAVQKKSNVSGSVSSVDGSVLNQRPVPNATNLLQGRVTGLQVTQPSGEPGRDDPNLLIRGRGSFGGSTSPLVLIDGVSGSLSAISPDDIENVTVLKDASSAAIYGARAANGVILVTTKSGSKGQTSINYRVNVGKHNPTSLPDFISNSAEYMKMYNQAAERSGISFRYPLADIEKYENSNGDPQYPSFDNLSYYIKPANVQQHNLSVNGGGEKNTYNISAGYLNQDGLIKGYSFKRWNGLLNYKNEVTDFLTVGTVVNGVYKDRLEPPFTGENMALSIYAAGPLYGPFLPDGSGRVVSRAYQNEGRNRNPQEYYAMGTQQHKNYDLNAQIYFDVQPIKNLTWTTKFAVNYTDGYYKMHQQDYDAYLLQDRNEQGEYIASSFGPDILGVTDQYSKTFSPTIYSVLNYQDTFSDAHNFSSLLGYEQVSYRIQSLRGRRSESVYPALDELTGYMPTGETLYFSHPRLPGVIQPSEWALQSLFARVSYNYDEKYFIESNLRYDGTSKVSPEYRWGLFPSFSSAWMASKEEFVQSTLPWLSELKFRASYGILGNQDIGTYLYQNTLDINNVYYSFDNETLDQGAVVNVFKDQSLRWESTGMLDLGIDVSIQNGLLGFSFDWFNKTTFDILANQPVPASLGLGQPTLNDGKLRNKGFEFDVFHNNTLGDFRYSINAQISKVRNELLHIRVPSYGSRIRENGSPYDAHYLYVWDGIFQEEDIDNPDIPFHELNPNPKPGDLKMMDINGDGVVDSKDRQVVAGAYPNFIYSFGLNLGYKNFGLNAFFQGVQGVKNRVESWGVDPFMQGTPPTTEWRDAWTPENRSNAMPAIYVAGYSGVENYKGSTYYLRDASYLRLKNIVLSYDFPETWLNSIRFKGAQVFVSADNLFTITPYKHADPERTSTSGRFAQYPHAKVFNVGASVKF